MKSKKLFQKVVYACIYISAFVWSIASCHGDVAIVKDNPDITSNVSRYQEFVGQTHVTLAPQSARIEDEEGGRMSVVATNLSFVVTASGPVTMSVSPKSWKIIKGMEYSINTSFFDPFVMKAQQDGKLEFQLNMPCNCTVLVEPNRGQNRLFDASSEEENESFSNWMSIQENDPLIKVTEKSRSGNWSLKIEKTVSNGKCGLKQKNTVVLQPGREYLASAYYYLENIHFGSAIQFSIKVRDQKHKELEFKDFYLNPLVYGKDKEWRRASVRFYVPKDYVHAECRIEITSSGAPLKSYWDDFYLGLAPTAVNQFRTDPNPHLIPLSEEKVEKIVNVREVCPAQVASIKGWPSLKIQNQEIPLFGFYGHLWTNVCYSAYSVAEKAGIQLHWVPLWTNYNSKKQYGNPIWLSDRQYDFSELDRRIKSVLSWAPQAKILLSVNLVPYADFGDKHSDAVWVGESGKKWVRTEKGDYVESNQRKEDERWAYSFSSDFIREEAADLFEKLGKYIASHPIGNAVAGIHIVGGGDGQWIHWDETKGDFDYSEGSRKIFQKWLKEKYLDVSELKKGWSDPSITFENASLPVVKDLIAEKGFFLDMKEGNHRRIFDAKRFTAESMVDTLDQLGHAYKKGVGRPSIVTIYYHDTLVDESEGYHTGLKRLLEKKNIDGVVSLVGYGGTRNLGMTGGYSSLFGSLALHQKLGILEMDYRTDYSNLASDAQRFRKTYGVPFRNGWQHQMRRDYGMLLAQGAGGWINDIGVNGWNSPEAEEGFKEVIQATHCVNIQKNEKPVEKGQIAVFCDEFIDSVTVPKTSFSRNLGVVSHKYVRPALLRSGLSWDGYVLSDLNHASRSDYRLNLFLSSPSIDLNQIQWIQKNMQNNGRVLVFVNACGFSSELGFEKSVEALTGIKVKVDLSVNRVSNLVPILPENRICVADEIPVGNISGPMFYVDDPDAIALATIAGTQKVGMAMRKFKDWTSIYICTPGNLTPKMIRNLANLAGLSPIGPENDITLSGNHLLVIHALKSGFKKLQWSEMCDLKDLQTQKVVAQDVNQYEFSMETGETRWFCKLIK